MDNRGRGDEDGGNRRTLRQKYRAIRRQVSAILREADPISLISAGAPADEYELEVGTIVPRIGEAASPELLQIIIHEEFVFWFGAEIAGPPEGYERTAEAIWNAY